MAELFLVSGLSMMVFGHIPEPNTALHMRFAMTVILWLPIGTGYVKMIGWSWLIQRELSSFRICYLTAQNSTPALENVSNSVASIAVSIAADRPS
jgi:hypothetical protein